MARSVEITYGNALFLAAENEERLRELLPEAEVILELWNSNQEDLRFVFMPELSDQEKLERINSLFPNQMPREYRGLFSVLLEKKHFAELPGILEYFIHEAKEALKIGVVSVESAVPLTDAQKQAIEEKLKQSTSYVTLEMDYKTDESLIGGMRIRIGDRLLDTSLRTKLSELTEVLRKS